jgi:DNA polymerase-3 subunit delta'
VIVDAAEDLEGSAFNALLKTLEEPPQGTFLLLVSHRAGRLPATIRSRCRVLRFPLLDDTMVAEALDFALPRLSPEVRAAAVAVGRGSPGAALDFASCDLAAAQGLMTRIAESGDPDFGLRGALLGEVGPRPDRDRQSAAIEAARRVLVGAVADADRARQARIIEAHSALARLGAQAPTYNFDPTALVLEIAGLLASVGDPREAVE